MPEASDRDERRERLATLVRQQAESEACRKRAEMVCRAGALRQTLADVGVAGDRAGATALMATAMLLAEAAPEWGGDYRDGLAEVAMLGLELLDS